MKYTPDQERAITRRNVSISLSAGAGCGKTMVLTERFLSHVTPQPPDGRVEMELGSLVAITFTERAAREMRDRIRRTTDLRLQEASDETTARYWLQLKQQLESARISTIHSFCASLLRSHAVEARLDPRFAVLEPAQAATLESELIDDELRSRLAEHDPVLIGLVIRFGLSRLRELIRVLVRTRHEISFSSWQKATPADVVERWRCFHGEEFVPRLMRTHSQDRRIRRVLQLLGDHVPSNEVMRRRRAILLDGLSMLSASEQPAVLVAELLDQAKVQGGGGKKAWENEEVAQAVQDALANLRGFLRSWASDLRFDPQAALVAASAGLELLQVVEGVVGRYEARKQEAAILDFDDLLSRACRLLTDPRNEPLRRQVASGIGLLLVDEFQDTDPLQVRLIEALCGEGLTTGRLFFVGDHKQSIYRFRGADPRVFRDLQERMPRQGRLPLMRNFRSQPAILNFVNALFAGELGPEYEPLQAARTQATQEPAVEFLWVPPEEKGESVAESRQREADWIARRLRELLDSAEPIIADLERGANAVRPLQPGDVVLLFRAMSDVEYYEEALRKYGIDYYVVGGHAFYGQQEIFDVLNLLRSLTSVSDGISLAGVLRSPFFSLSDESLFWLAQHGEGLAGGLFDRVPAQIEGSQRQRIEFAARTILELREMKDRVPVASLLQTALDRTGYDAALMAEFLGERKLANLRKLLEQARDFDQSGLFTLQDFVVQLDEFVSRQPKEAPAATQPAESEVVRLMTIHQAKGLEFPLVVVVDVSRRQRRQGAGVAFDATLGPLVQPRNDNGGDDRSTTGYTMYETLEQLEDAAESKRLLYVATTRAADYLILSATHHPDEAPSGPWMTELLAQRFDLQTGAFVGILPAGCDPPQVRVTCTRPRCLTDRSRTQRGGDLGRMLEEIRRTSSGERGVELQLLRTLPPDKSARRQYSFSRLSGQLGQAKAHTTVELDEPTPVGVSSLDRRGLGTLVHAVLAELPFERSFEGDVDRYVRRHASHHLSDGAEQEVGLASRMIAQFLASEMARRLSEAKQRYTELEFLLGWPVGHMQPEGPYLQGYIDSLYQDVSGAWHIVDYKTNEVSAEQVPAAAQAYELQMLVYALAVEQVVGEPPASNSLYFLRPGVAYPFQFSAQQRARLVELVETVLAGQNGAVSVE